MTLAETASIFSEFLVFQGALEKSTSEGRLALIEHFLQDATQVCVDILSRYYFESAVFSKRKEGDLSASAFSALMEDAQKKDVRGWPVRLSSLHVGCERTLLFIRFLFL